MEVAESKDKPEVAAKTISKSDMESAIAAPRVIKIGAHTDLLQHSGKFDPNRVRFFLYGESGSGKTRLAATWPACVFADADDGMASVKSNKVYRVPIKTWTDLEIMYQWLARGEHKFKTVVLDSLNELQRMCLGNIVTEFTTIHRAYNDLPSQSDYGKLMDEFDKRMRDFKSLPMNIIFISQVANRENDFEQIKPQLMGKNTAKEMVRMSDVVGFIAKSESSGGGDSRKSRVLHVDSVEYVTKDRSGSLPQMIKDPTYVKLYSYWSAGTEQKSKVSNESEEKLDEQHKD